MYYWVIQELGSETVLHGPYRSEDSRDNRYERVSGGIIHKFNSMSSDPKVVKQEFISEKIKGLDL